MFAHIRPEGSKTWPVLDSAAAHSAAKQADADDLRGMYPAAARVLHTDLVDLAKALRWALGRDDHQLRVIVIQELQTLDRFCSDT